MTVALIADQVIAGDGSPPQRSVAVLFGAGRIIDVVAVASIPHEARRVEYPGGTVIPGLVNLHSHMVAREGTVTARALGAARRAERDLRSGITTSRDLGAPDRLDVELRAAIGAGLARGPDLIVAACPIMRTGGHNHAFGREADGPVEVRRAVREQVKAGATCIKLMASEGWTHPFPHRLGLSVEEMAAAVDEAHRLGVGTTVHAQGPQAARAAIEAGVDCIEHATDGITDDVISLFLSTGRPLDSTSSSAWVAANAPEGTHPAALVAAARRQVDSERVGLAKCVAAGVRITGATDMHGTMELQYRLLREAGMAALDALSALTSRPAEVLGLADRGRIARGLRADLVVLGADPLDDPAALGRPEAVFQKGEHVA